jgi:hypothetical protein
MPSNGRPLEEGDIKQVTLDRTITYFNATCTSVVTNTAMAFLPGI